MAVNNNDWVPDNDDYLKAASLANHVGIQAETPADYSASLANNWAPREQWYRI